jgi:hypothetical protein
LLQLRGCNVESIRWSLQAARLESRSKNREWCIDEMNDAAGAKSFGLVAKALTLLTRPEAEVKYDIYSQRQNS